jgi:hypothetical protein
MSPESRWRRRILRLLRDAPGDSTAGDVHRPGMTGDHVVRSRVSAPDGSPVSPEGSRPLPVNTPDGPVAERVVSRRYVRSGLLGVRDGWEERTVRAQVLLRNQVLRFSMPQRVGLAARHAFRENQTGQLPWREGDEGSPARLMPRLRPSSRFVSAGELVAKAKAFDDGLLAAVEVASQEACGAFRGKRPLLRAMREKLADGGRAASLIEAACELGGCGTARSPAAREILRRFLADECQSKPIGFYTWAEELSRIYRQDRLLQADLLGAEDAPHVAAALAGTHALLAGYSQCLRLAEQCTNQLVCTDFRPWAKAIAKGDVARGVEPGGERQASLALFPASRSHETDLARRLYGTRPIPEDADLLRDLIRAVRSGAVDLRPGSGSGWYDWQTWALETLVSPDRAEESGRVSLNESYRQYLEDLFRAALALGRETHVKQLEVPMCGASMPPPVIVHPDVRLEPLVSHYARRAEGYRFVRAVLDEQFGEPALSRLRGWRRDRTVDVPLAAELEFMIALLDGAANVARLELGAPSQGGADVFVRWMASRDDDPDITADLRMMVPVYFDVGRKRTRVWMFLGWMEDSIDVSFASPPEVRSLSGRRLEARPESSTYPIAKPVVVDALVSRLLDRDEFRALCDRHATPEAILSVVQ